MYLKCAIYKKPDNQYFIIQVLLEILANEQFYKQQLCSQFSSFQDTFKYEKYVPIENFP